MAVEKTNTFGELLRSWRMTRRASQLERVLAATRREKRKEIFLGLGEGRTQTWERISELQSQITTPHRKDALHLVCATRSTIMFFEPASDLF